MTDHVKIHGVVPRIQYTADGVLTTYEFPFAIFSEDDIEVYLNDIKQVSTSYTVPMLSLIKNPVVSFSCDRKSQT